MMIDWVVEEEGGGGKRKTEPFVKPTTGLFSFSPKNILRLPFLAHTSTLTRAFLKNENKTTCQGVDDDPILSRYMKYK